MNIYLVMILGGILGIAGNAIKTIGAINKRNDNTNFKKTWSMFWASETFALSVSVFCYGILLFVASDFVNLDKLDTPDYGESLKERLFHFKIATFIKTTSIICGYFSNSIVYGFLGVTEKKIKSGIAGLYSAPKDDELKK